MLPVQFTILRVTPSVKKEGLTTPLMGPILPLSSSH
jgi:hypothetical protein